MEGRKTLISLPGHDRQGGFSGTMAVRCASSGGLSKAEATVFPIQAKEKRRVSEGFSETCSSLNDWSTANTVVEPDPDHPDRLIVRDTLSITTSARRFIRLRVQVSP